MENKKFLTEQISLISMYEKKIKYFLILRVKRAVSNWGMEKIFAAEKKSKLKKTAFDIYECCRHKKSRTDDGHQKSLSKDYLEKIIEYLSREYRTQNCWPTCSVGEKSAECR